MLRRFWISLVLILLLLVVIYTGVVRPYIMRWGATDAEIAAAYPSDPFIPPHTVVSTRALTIHAPPDAVWPWLVQLGQGRGGFYSFEWLENLFAADMHNAPAIDPALQDLMVGEKIYYQKGSFYATTSVVEAPQVVALEGWSFNLIPLDNGDTRLVVRYPSFPVNNRFAAFYYYVIFEPAHFVMEAGMMLGLKARAEGSL